MVIAYQVLILFIVVLAGALCRRLRYLTDEAIAGITKLVINISVPCLTLYNMQREFSMEMFRGFLVSMLLGAFTMLLGIAIGWFGFAKRPRLRRIVMAQALGFSNCGFMGYPVILAINPDWMMYAVAYNMAYNFVFWTLGVSLYGTGSGKSQIVRVLRNPSLIASILGFVLFCLRFTWPDFIYSAMGSLGGLTTPLSMLLIGTRVYGINLRNFRDPDYYILTVIRLAILPVLCRLLLMPLHLDPAIVGATIILTAMPAGSLVPMLAESNQGDAVFAARVVAFSTLVSLVTIPLISVIL